MKIIKEGIPEKLKPKTIFTCDSCECEFEFDKNDAKTVSNINRVYSVECPWCGEFHLFHW
jgi:hypothetical protein